MPLKDQYIFHILQLGESVKEEKKLKQGLKLKEGLLFWVAFDPFYAVWGHYMV